MSRSFNHSCGRACGICAYTAARNKRAEAAVVNDNRNADAHAIEREDDHSYCDGYMCSYCDPDYMDSPRYAGDFSPLRAPIWRRVA